MSVPAAFTDGQSAGRFAAELRAEGGDLLILRDEGRDVTRWPLAEIRALRDLAGPDQLVLQRPGEDARLILESPQAIAWIRVVAPALERAETDRAMLRKLMLWGSGAAAGFLLLLLVILPGLAERMAPLIPPDREADFGLAMRAQAAALFSPAPQEARFCTARAGSLALDQLAAALTKGADLPHPLQVSVLNGPMVNAFAMPGGQVVLLRGLIEAAESPEEVAAVLAHEIGHVAARDPTRAALRAAGTAGLISLALGDITGGALIGSVTSQLMEASYSRAAERAADEYAAQRLRGAQVSPEALARFFDRLAEGEEAGGGGGLEEYFASHPAPADRAASIRAAHGQAPERPLLTQSDWHSLRAICSQTAAAPR